MKEFNTNAVCNPSKHYMVDLSSRVAEITKMVEEGKYFTINRARQYGKTTTLYALKKALETSYVVISLDFQGIDDDSYRTGGTFAQALAQLIIDEKDFNGLQIPADCLDDLLKILKKETSAVRIADVFRAFKKWCLHSDSPVVLMIDEVDSAANNRVFLDFLAQLRDGYISRETKGTPTFRSVILAGVTDVTHLKSRIRSEDQHKVNSPWNIAADFLVDMSFNAMDIKGMLDEYEADHETGMDTDRISGYIEEYTNGYPFLVSRICQLIDKQLVPAVFPGLTSAWTEYGVDEAVKKLLGENNSLFDSLMGKLVNYPELKQQLRDILLKGITVAYLPDDEPQKQLRMYGFIENRHNVIAIANRIFEMRLYQHFIGENKPDDNLKQTAAASRSIFTCDGCLNMPLILEHFVRAYGLIHGDSDEKFLEEEGRERFLTYLSPIINGTGTYSIEEQTRDRLRMDVVIHYLGRRYICELKIWRGSRYNEEGEKQILDYLDHFSLDTGYMVSFSFKKNKKPGVHRLNICGKTLYEAIV